MSKLFRLRLAILGFAAMIFVTPSIASAAERITNGTFNANTSGWTLVQLTGSGCSYGFSSVAVTGLTGGHVVATASDPSQCGFYQDVTLASGTTNRLTVSIGSDSNGGTALDIGAVQIRDTSNVILQTLYSHNGTNGIADPVSSRGPFNLDAYAGQTIRVFFYTRHASTPYSQRVDNVSLDSTVTVAAVPTLSEWAMIFLGVLLAGGTAIHLQRRQKTA